MSDETTFIQIKYPNGETVNTEFENEAQARNYLIDSEGFDLKEVMDMIFSGTPNGIRIELSRTAWGYNSESN